MKRLFLILFLSIYASLFAFSQKNEYIPDASQGNGKPLTFRDSLKIQDLFISAIQEKMKMNMPEAIQNFEKILILDPENHATLFELANIYTVAKDYDRAKNYLDKALNINPNNEWYWILMADIYNKTNRIEELIPVYTEIIKLTPKQEAYYYELANVYYVQGEDDKVLATYREIENRFGSSDDLNARQIDILFQSKRFTELEEDLKKQISLKPNDVKNYFLITELYVKTNNRPKAIDLLQKAKNQFPTNGRIRLLLADQFVALKQFENAFIELKVAFSDAELKIDEKVRIILSFFPMFSDMRARAYANELASIMVKTHPDEAKAFAMQGDVLFQEAKYKEAQNSYKKALEINDQVYQVWEQLLRIELSIGDYQELISDGNKALEIFPNQAALYLYSGIGYAQLKNHDKAVLFLKSALDLALGDKELLVQIFSSLGDSFNALKKFKDSDASFEQVLTLDPDNFYVLNNYAYYLSLRGERLDLAERMSKRSLELNPDNPSFEDTYAWILFRLKRYAEAKKWIEKSLQGKPDNNATQLEHYGDILFYLGDQANALEQWKKAKAAGANSEKLNKKINEKKYID